MNIFGILTNETPIQLIENQCFIKKYSFYIID
jgi:hypothetical protein